MNNYLELYKQWLAYPKLDEQLRADLEAIKDNDEEIQTRFYQDLSFGTAGLRGKMGAGTNRMNKYVIARATKALGLVMQQRGLGHKAVALAHDCRIKSDEFAKIAALTLASMGIKAYLFDSLRPTPELSYAVRYYNCGAGINITASHNPKEYNGYKVYWQEGSQIKSDVADDVLKEISKLSLFDETITLTFEEAIEKNLIEIINHEVDEAFYQETMKLALRGNEIDKNIKVVYTPLNGAGNIPVRTVLKRLGYQNVYVVPQQEAPDGTFPTIEYPNPEDHAAFEYAEKLALDKGADILIATDPDCDRLAVEIIDHDGQVFAFNGNQIGVVLVDYVLKTLKEKNRLPQNGAIVKSIVTSEMSQAICAKYGIKMFDVLTGFKNICALPNEWDHTQEYKYVMGFEESIGYNIGDHLRDKDGVGASVILCEAAAYYKTQNKNLKDVLYDLFKEYGYYFENTTSLVLDGIKGQARIGRMMKEYRHKYPKTYQDLKLVEVTDYLNSTITNVLTNEVSVCMIEKTDCVKFKLDDGSWYALRPSGTEPKIKVYCYSKADDEKTASDKLKLIEHLVLEALNSIE